MAGDATQLQYGAAVAEMMWLKRPKYGLRSATSPLARLSGLADRYLVLSWVGIFDLLGWLDSDRPPPVWATDEVIGENATRTDLWTSLELDASRDSLALRRQAERTIHHSTVAAISMACEDTRRDSCPSNGLPNLDLDCHLEEQMIGLAAGTGGTAHVAQDGVGRKWTFGMDWASLPVMGPALECQTRRSRTDPNQ